MNGGGGKGHRIITKSYAGITTKNSPSPPSLEIDKGWSLKTRFQSVQSGKTIQSFVRDRFILFHVYKIYKIFHMY